MKNGNSASQEPLLLMIISRESVYIPYTVENQQLKCLHKTLHFLKRVYIVDNQQSKCLH
jgi:hypothetical protein